MGILNVTPDSFSDGGKFDQFELAIAHAEALMASGADLIDVGGESTRPGADFVPLEEELRRVLPVIERLSQLGIPTSIDSQKPEVAQAAIQAGASVVNDVSGLQDPKMIAVVAESGASVCIMHRQGDPKTMQANPTYKNVVQEVRNWLQGQVIVAQSQGVLQEQIWLDPGIGFGKNLDHNLALIRNLDAFATMGFPILFGASRKSFLGKILDCEGHQASIEDREDGTLAVNVIAQINGARILRVHNVKRAVHAMRVVQSVWQGE